MLNFTGAKRFLKLVLPIRLCIILDGILKKIKKRYVLGLIASLKPLESKGSPQYIISLTSYGKRLVDTVLFALITLFNQNIRPDRIILWIANDEKECIPPIMEKLIEKGLEIYFCEDIKSYKKLIPAIENFPEDYIITADDDIYYPKNWFEQLMIEHKKYPKKIVCHRANGIKVDGKHNPIPYIKWDGCIRPSIYFARISMQKGQSVLRHQLESVFPTGGAGTLYPPSCFHKDIANKELFMKLAPYADDIWFWTMAVINIEEYFGGESPYVVIENGVAHNLQNIETREQRDNDSLRNFNCLQNGNDRQLKAVIEHYPQVTNVLKKIQPFQYKNKEYSLQK